MRAEFGVEAESVIEGLRTYMREQRQIERDRRKKLEKDEEKRRCVMRDEEVAESASWEVVNEMVNDDRRNEAEGRNELERGDGKGVWEAEEKSEMMDGVEEEWERGRKGIGMAGRCFWQTRQVQLRRREEGEEEATQRQQTSVPHFVTRVSPQSFPGALKQARNDAPRFDEFKGLLWSLSNWPDTSGPALNFGEKSMRFSTLVAVSATANVFREHSGTPLQGHFCFCLAHCLRPRFSILW